MRKPAFCICENKDADQLCGNREADQRLCFRYIDSTIPLFIFCGCTARFVSDLVTNPEDRFSQNEAPIGIKGKNKEATQFSPFVKLVIKIEHLLFF